MIGLRARLHDSAYAGGWALVRALPEPVALRLFRTGADLAGRRGGKSVDRLRANLARVAVWSPDDTDDTDGTDDTCDLDVLTRDALRSYARYWCEVFRLQVLSTERILAATTTEGEDAFRTALADDRGVILALPHAGNWDQAGAWCGATGAPFTTVAERLRPESLYDRFVAFRTSLGMEVLPLTGGARPPFDVLTERLEAGGMLCLMADRDLSARGVEVELFGSTARFPAGPASLALKTGAVLFPVTLSFTKDGWHIVFHPAVAHTDVPAMAQDLAHAFERGIAAHPADWHMVQKLWLEDL